MEQTNLPSNSNASASLPTSLLVSQQQLANAIQGFGEDFRQFVMCRYTKPTSLYLSVKADAPTFREITSFFGEYATQFWLRFHIAETFAFLGIYDTASKFQVQHTADLIMQHEIYGQLTPAEFLTFLQKFKVGEYGKIYQSARPNPQEFLACLKPFWTELSQERIRFNEQQNASRSHREDKENLMTYDEWLEIKTITAMYNSDFTVTDKDYNSLLSRI